MTIASSDVAAADTLQVVSAGEVFPVPILLDHARGGGMCGGSCVLGEGTGAASSTRT